MATFPPIQHRPLSFQLVQPLGHPWPQVLLLDRLWGHLGVLVSDDFYGRIKRKGHTRILTSNLKGRLYVVNNRLCDLINICIFMVLRLWGKTKNKCRKLTPVDSSHSLSPTFSPDLLFTPWPFVFPWRVFSGRYPPVATTMSNSNDDDDSGEYMLESWHDDVNVTGEDVRVVVAAVHVIYL